MRRPMIWAICISLMLAGMLCAETPSSSELQTESASEKVESAPLATSPNVKEVLPPLYHLEDTQGKLHPAFGFTLEEFRQAYNQIHGLESQSRCPAYVLKKVTVTGRAHDHHAQLTVACDILLQREGMIRIPLSLGRAVITGEPEYDGQGIPLLTFEEKTGSYVAWVKGKADQQCRLVLKTLVPLTVVGDKTVLRLRIPSGTESELKVTVPMSHAVAEASEGSMLEVVPSKDEKETLLNVHGPRGDFELSWHKPEIRAASAPTVLEADGQILVRIDNHSIHSQTTLHVHGYGKPFDHFRIRLPIDTEMIPSTGTAYRIVELSKATAKKGRIVEVRLPEKTLGPVSVRLAARRVLDTSLLGQWIELTGFEVLNAARQSGHLAVEVTDDLDLLWNPQLGVQQSEDLPDSLVHENLVAGFKYFTQPCSLLVRIAPRQTRVSVEPQYLVLVGADQVQLDTTFKYTIRGKKARVFDIHLGNWQFDEIGPDNVVAVDRVIQDESGNLSIPLRQPSSGKIDLNIRAHRRLANDENILRLTFPQAKVTTPGPAAVVIVPDDRIQLTVDTKATEGLTRQQVAPPMAAPERQQSPLFYRGDMAKAVLVAQRDIHAQQVAVTSTTTVMLDQQAGQVKQKLSYRIDYEPLDKLTFELPQELQSIKENIMFRVQGQRVMPSAMPSIVPGQQPDEESSKRVFIALGGPRIGTCDVEIEYPLTLHQLVPRSSTRREVPLVTPLDGKLTGNRLSVISPSELNVAMLGDSWKPQASDSKSAVKAIVADHQLLKFAADGTVNQAVLGLCLEERETARATVVQRAFIQTWILNGHIRQDRAIFRLDTHEKHLNLVLPKGTVLQKTTVFLNGKPVKTETTGEASLRLDLPRRNTNASWLLEVRSHGNDTEVLRGRRKLVLPGLGEGTWVRRLYWQLTLPKYEHIVNAPEGLAQEFHWGWNGLFWQRDPLLKTDDLEAWMDMPSRTQLTNGDSYLFSGFGPSDSFEIVVVSRSWIVLGASGAALVFGLLLIYVPVSRHPGVLFVLAIGLGCTGLLYPESTLLALQAAVLGLVLTLVAGLLERGIGRRRRGLISRDATGSRIAMDSTQTQFLAAGTPPGNSATTALQEELPSNQASSTTDGSDVIR